MPAIDIPRPRARRALIWPSAFIPKAMARIDRVRWEAKNPEDQCGCGRATSRQSGGRLGPGGRFTSGIAHRAPSHLIGASSDMAIFAPNPVLQVVRIFGHHP